MVRRSRRRGGKPISGKRREKPISEICETSGGLKDDSPPPPPGKKPRSGDSSRSSLQEVGQTSGGELEEAPTRRRGKAKYELVIETRGVKKKPETIEEREFVASKLGNTLFGDPYEDYRRPGDGEVLDMKIMRKYLKQVKKSDGFDVDVYPGPCPAATVIPVTNIETNPDVKKRLVEMATLALEEYNEDNEGSEGVPFQFKEIERATFLRCSGVVYYITFKAREAETANVKTFRAKVYDRVLLGARDVTLVKLKDDNN